MATEGSGYSIGHKEGVPTDEGCGEGDWVALGDQQFRPAVVDDGRVPANARPDDDRRVARGTRESNWARISLGSLPAGRWLIAAMIPLSAGYNFLWRWMSSGSRAKSSGNGSAIGW
jgi:hypothetical protein